MNTPAGSAATPPTSPDVWHGLLAHDLKNALALLEGELDALRTVPTPAAANEAHAQCRALRQRLEAMLTVARGQTQGGLVAHITDDDPLALLEAVAAAARRQRPELEITVPRSAESQAWWTYDPHLVRMAMDAAMHNALRFAHQRIELRSIASDGGLALQVLDDGPGLGQQPVWWPSGSAARSTGVGTPLCEAVAMAHACGGRCGRAAVTPCGLTDRGVRFELWLP